MDKKINIVKCNIDIPIIDSNGNLNNDISQYRFWLQNENGEVLSNQYHCIEDLGNDHFAVCNLDYSMRYFSNYNYYDIIGEEYEVVNPKLKWGIIRINRDSKGNIIPKGETLIAPYVYDRISSNNLKTATVYKKYEDYKLSYFDIDIYSENYGKQLIPCVLDHAVPFSVEYEGFAECSIDGKVGYLPRDMKARNFIQKDELLTEPQTNNLSEYFKGNDSVRLGYLIISDYFNLTGIILEPELKKQKKIKKY